MLVVKGKKSLFRVRKLGLNQQTHMVTRKKKRPQAGTEQTSLTPHVFF